MKEAEDTTASLCAEICASIPQYIRLPRRSASNGAILALAVVNKSRDDLDTYLNTERRASSTAFESAKCYSLILPLNIAVQCATCPEVIR